MCNNTVKGIVLRAISGREEKTIIMVAIDRFLCANGCLNCYITSHAPRNATCTCVHVHVYMYGKLFNAELNKINGDI